MRNIALTFSPGAGYRGLLLVLLATVGGLITNGAWKAHEATRAALDQDRTRSVRLASSAAAYQASWLEHTQQLLRVLGGISLGTRSTADSCSAFLARQQESFSEYDNLAFARADGQIWCSAQAWPDATRLPVSDNGVQVMSLDRHQLALSYPHKASDGHIQGSVIASFDSEKLFPKTQGALPADSDYGVFDSRGKLLAAHPSYKAWQFMDVQLAQRLHNLDSGSVLRHTDRDGVERFYALAPIAGASETLWLLVRSPINDDLKLGPISILLVLGIVILALSLWHLSKIFALYLHGRVTTPWRLWLFVKDRLRAHGRFARRAWWRLLSRASNQGLKLELLQKEDRVRQLLQLDELSQTLQNCSNVPALADAVVRCARSLFPGSYGNLFIALGDQIEVIRAWGDAPLVQTLETRDCPALRTERPYACVGKDLSLCAHAQNMGEHLCLPLIAHKEVQGMLQIGDLGAVPRDEVIPWAASSIAQRAASALAILRQNEQLQRRAIRDALTGLFNRGFMEEALSIEQQRAARRGLPVGILMLDVDHFKRFNDSFGHDAGDVLLRGLGEILRRTVREGDMACRYGGEEFVVIMPGADSKGTQQRAEVLRAAVERWQPIHADGDLRSVTVSIGVAAFPSHGNSWQQVLKAADQALYSAKHAGRNQVIAAPIEEAFTDTQVMPD